MAAYFKKYSKNIMSMIVVFTFVAALFCPSDDFLAVTEVGSSSYSFNATGPVYVFSGTDGQVENDSWLFDDHLLSDSYQLAGFNYDWSNVGVSYFDVTVTEKSFINSGQSSDYTTYEHVYILYNGEKYYLNRISSSGYTSVYRGYLAIPTNGYVFSVGIDVYGELSPVYDEIHTFYCSYDVSVFNVFYEFTEEELSNLYGNSEIVTVLREQVQLDYDIIDKLETLIDSQEEANGILQSIYLKLCELFTMLGGGGIEDVPTDDITDLEDKEDALIGEVNPEDAADDLVVTIDPNGSNLLWTVFDNVITSNGEVFAAFISLLSLGVIALILNR